MAADGKPVLVVNGYTLDYVTGGKPARAEDIYRTITVGVPGTHMPAWGRVLSREERKLLTRYLMALSPRFWRRLEVADGLEEWFVAGAADGFNLLPATFPEGLNLFVDLVIPELQRRGLFRTEYEGRTLRDNLGLPMPKNRWSRN